jgi:glutathione synthase/RimK-type ligase-like ATP-grasp enzyme
MSNEAPRILIVSTQVDVATDYVIRSLSHIAAPFFRINTEEFPLGTHSSFYVGRSPNSQTWHWAATSITDTDLKPIRAVWYRRHRLPQMPSNLSEAHTEYCLRESEWFVKGCVLSLGGSPDVAWMSHPAKVQMAESKIYQLTVAKSVGFTVPDTLVSNQPAKIRGFFQKHGGAIIAKPLRLGYFDYGERQTSVYTNQVEWQHLQDDRELELAPVVFQELLPKRFDIRVTIVGKRVFAVAIHSQEVESARIDWRRTETEDLPHSIHDLPLSIKTKCLEFMHKLGLTYGALDFVLTPTDEYFFLEVNPNGQWVWMEDKLALPISRSIASWLEEHSRN